MDPKLLMKILQVTFTGGPEGRKKTELLTHRRPQNSYTAVQLVHTPNETKSIRKTSSDLKSFVPQFFQLLLWNLAKTRENIPHI